MIVEKFFHLKVNKEKYFWVDYWACLIFGAVLVPLYLFVRNYPFFSTGSLLGVVAFFAGVHVVCFWILRLFLKEKRARVFFLFCVWLGQWGCYKLIRKCFATASVELVVFTIFLMIFLVAFVFSRGRGSAVCCRLVSTVVWLLFAWQIIYGVVKCLYSTRCCWEKEEIVAPINSTYPNIYHILLDAHPNQEGLEKLGGDLRPFYSELKQLGFICYPRSESVYPATTESVPAMWHMDADLHNTPVTNSVVFEVLREHYNMVFTASVRLGFLYPLQCNHSAGGFCEFLLTLLDGSSTKSYLRSFLKGIVVRGLRNESAMCLEAIETGKQVYGSLGNFFYTHILVPHFPIIYGEGSSNAFPLIGGVFCKEWGCLERYFPYVCQNCYGIDDLVFKAIKAILEQYEDNPVKPIIVLHSDHGLCCKSDENSIYGNLFAIYMPDEWKKDAKDLKFINLYRFIFNHLFGTNYEYLPDVRKNVDGSIFKEKTLPSSES